MEENSSSEVELELYEEIAYLNLNYSTPMAVEPRVLFPVITRAHQEMR